MKNGLPEVPHSRVRRFVCVSAPVIVGAFLGSCSTPEPVANARSSTVTTSARPTSSITTLEVSAYPLDRSLKGLAEWPDLDAVVTVNGITKGETRDLTAAGENQLPAIVTVARGEVTRSIWSRAKVASTVALVVPGGTAGNKVLNAGPESAPDWARLTDGSPVIVGGAFSDLPGVGTVLEPSFVYALAPNGTLTSLLESGTSDPYPSFSLAEMESALKARR